MINTNYFADLSHHDSGGYCDFLPVKDCPDLGFKSFKNKSKASLALFNQHILAEFDLAPEPITNLCQIYYYYDSSLLEVWTPKEPLTSWGFVTERATLIDYTKKQKPYLHKIQELVDSIWEHTKLKFWDCHEHNVGYIKRGRFKKLVCIDTGKESFESYSNAWGFESPGPKCSYCNTYKCKCEDE